MKTPSLLLVSVLMLLAAVAASGRTVTLTVTGWTGSPGYRLTNPPANLFFRIRADRLP